MQMKYDTNNIDEAAYLALQGYDFTVTRTGPISALFSFQTDEHFDEVRAKFWKGEVTVNLHSWLATRVALKNECAGQALSAKRVPSPSLVPAECATEAVVTTGSAYWYHDGNTIKRALFGNRSPHTSRLADGNFYRTSEDAQLKRNAVQVCVIEVTRRRQLASVARMSEATSWFWLCRSRISPCSCGILARALAKRQLPPEGGKLKHPRLAPQSERRLPVW